MLHDHPDAWPGMEPVDARDVPDYYDIIKDPMDLKTMLKRLEPEQYYVTFEMFGMVWKYLTLLMNLKAKSYILSSNHSAKS